MAGSPGRKRSVAGNSQLGADVFRQLHDAGDEPHAGVREPLQKFAMRLHGGAGTQEGEDEAAEANTRAAAGAQEEAEQQKGQREGEEEKAGK